MGVENGTFDSSPLVLSLRFNIGVTSAPPTVLLDSIEFDLAENVPNFGYAEGKYDHITYRIEVDFGFGEYFEPFISAGFLSSIYISHVNYKLYNSANCNCETNVDLAKTSGTGFLTGVGFKIKPVERFIFDFRINYSGIWLKKKNDFGPMLDLNSFSINDDGEPVVDFIHSSFLQDFTIRAGITFPFPTKSGNQESYSNDYNNSDYKSDTTPSKVEKEECEPLVPKKRKSEWRYN